MVLRTLWLVELNSVILFSTDKVTSHLSYSYFIIIVSVGYVDTHGVKNHVHKFTDLVDIDNDTTSDVFYGLASLTERSGIWELGVVLIRPCL